MNLFTTLQAKIFSTFLVLAVSMVIAASIILRQIQYSNTAGNTIVFTHVPTIQALQKSSSALQQANEAVLSAVTQDTLRTDALSAYEVRFYNALSEYNMYYHALLHGSESEEFKTYAGGVVFTTWQLRSDATTPIIRPVTNDVRTTLIDSGTDYRTFVRSGQQLFSLLRQQRRAFLLNNTQSTAAIQQQIEQSVLQFSEVVDAVNRQTKQIVRTNNAQMNASVVELINTQKPLILSLLLSLLVLLILLTGSLIANRMFILQPIALLTKSAKQFAAGDFTNRANINRNDEIGLLAKAFNSMADNLEEVYTTLEERVETQTAELTKKVGEANDQRRAMLNIIEDFEESRISLEESSERLQKAKEAIEQEAVNTKKFKDALDASTSAVAILDNKAHVIYLNRAWVKVTGVAEAELLHKSINTIFTEHTNTTLITKYHQAMQKQRAFSSDAFVCQKDDELYDAKVTMYPVQTKRGGQFFVHIHEDITEQKKIERAKSEFVSLASHQLRTPLTALRWIFDMFTKGKLGKLTDKQNELLQDAVQCADHMADTVGAMLTLSRVEAGKIQLQNEPIAICAFWKQLWANHKAAAEQKNLRIDCKCEPELQQFTDATMLQEIVQNLVSNAIKYTPQDGTVTVKFFSKNEQFHIEVSDSGYGIPKKQQEKIFTKFFRADNVVEKETEGTGLGLYLVHSLVKLLGGTITFTSEENTGTTFYCTFPHRTND